MPDFRNCPKALHFKGGSNHMKKQGSLFIAAALIVGGACAAQAAHKDM
jgi:hypothetical protein